MTTRGTRHLPTFLFLLVAALAVTITTTGLVQAQGSARRGGDRADGPVPATAVPSVEEMAAAVSATPEQRAALAEARLAWLEALKDRRAERGGRGPGWARTEARPTPPWMVFLTEAAPSLDTGETLALVALLEEHRAAGSRPGAGLAPRRGGGRGDGPGAGRGPGRGMGHGSGQGMGQGMNRGDGRGHGHGQQDMLVHRLDLTDEQTQKVDALYATTRGALRALRGQVEPGAEPTPALEEEASRLRAEHQTRLQEILTEAQMRKLLELRAERRVERAQMRQERFEADKAQRLEQLGRVLDLEDAQRDRIAGALDEAHARATQEMARRWEEGGPMANLFGERGQQRGELREETQREIRDVLGPEQRELFARLQTLAAGPRGGRGDGRHGNGHGPGHGPGHGKGHGQRHGSVHGENCDHGPRGAGRGAARGR